MGEYVDGITFGYVPFASNYVDSGFHLLTQMAQNSYAETLGFIGKLSSFTVAPVNVSANFTPPTLDFSVKMPAAPKTPDTSVNLGQYEPGQLSTDPVTTDPADSAPKFTAAAPSLNYEAKPGVLTAVPPSNPPVPSKVFIPQAPNIVLPNIPALFGQSIPALPTINLPTFNGNAPDSSSLVAPNPLLIWSENRYDSALLDSVTNRVATMLLGGTGLPSEIETAIWDRGRAREDIAGQAVVQQAMEDFASRGWMMPTGALAARLSEVRQATFDKSADLSRQVAIEQAKLEVENLRFAVSQGIMLEGQMMEYEAGFAQRALEYARATVEAAISVFNARIALFNANLAKYQTQAQVFRDLLQAELSKLEIYKAELDGQRLIGEINTESIALYNAQLNGLRIQSELFKDEIDAARLTVEVDRNRIENFRALVDVFSAQVQAKSSEYQAWAEGMRGEAVKEQIYSTQAQAFATLTEAYRVGDSAKIERTRLALQKNETLVHEFQARLQYFSELLRMEVDRVNASVQIYDGLARVYTADVGAEEAQLRAQTELLRLQSTNAEVAARLELDAANINVNQIQRSAQIESETLKAAGAAAAQLTAGAEAALNISAHLTTSTGLSIDNRLDETHQFTS